MERCGVFHQLQAAGAVELSAVCDRDEGWPCLGAAGRYFKDVGGRKWLRSSSRSWQKLGDGSVAASLQNPSGLRVPSSVGGRGRAASSSQSFPPSRFCPFRDLGL